jgi:high-affinity iron transporter
MLEALVVTLREGVEAALIIGITLAYLNKTGRTSLRKTVYAALAAALVGSVAVAIGLRQTSFNPDLFEGWVMLVASFFVVSMVFFMAKAAKSLKGDIEKRVGGFADTGSQLGLFLFVFLMVLREGVETVLILSAVSFTTSELLSFMGTLAGVFLSILFGVMFVRGSVRINLGKFFKVTTVILIFVAFQLLISGLHELSETGVLPSSKRQMAIIGPIVRNDIFFFVTMLALTALMVLFESKRREPEAVSQESKAEQRKQQWSARREKFWTTSVYVSSFVFIVLVTAQFIYAKSTTSLSSATEVVFSSGKTTVDVADMQPGELRRYSATLNGKPVRFLIYKKPNGKIATVMDACAICGSVGFYNNGAQGITCKNCNAPVNPQSVGEGGGCNPIPLVAQVNGSTVTVSEMDLTNGASQIKE